MCANYNKKIEKKYISRIAEKGLILPDIININIKNDFLYMNNNINTLKLKIKNIILVNIIDNKITLSINNNANYFFNKKKLNFIKSYSGTIMSILNNMIIGLTKGFYKKILLIGIGYKVLLDKENLLKFYLGYSHIINFDIPKNIFIKSIINNNEIVLYSFDKQLLGNICYKIKLLRKINIYKGKGIKYDYDVIKIKELKKK